MTHHPKIGVSACLLHPDPKRDSYAPKTLQFIEQSTAAWLLSGGALPVMIPALQASDNSRSAEIFANYAQWLDGLVLHGGADVWPGSYGELPLRKNWNGDRTRDEYEIALVKAFVAAGKPVFGVCRGLQLVNVAFGGTLYQDIATQRPSALKHYEATAFDLNFHQIEVVPHTHLAGLLGDSRVFKTNSIHHQGIKDLAPGFAAEAHCPEDGLIEAIRHTGPAFVAAVQWHPEFHAPGLGTVDDKALLDDFLHNAKQAHNPSGGL